MTAQTATQSTQSLFSTPENFREDPMVTSEGVAAQNMIYIMEATPLDSPLTAYDWKLLGANTEYDAQTAYLAALSDW